MDRRSPAPSGVTQMHLRTLNIAAGEIVRFIAVSDVRNYLELLDATGTSVAAAENFLQTTVPTAGRYTLIVRAYFSHQPINFSLSFQQLRNPCGATELNCGQTISGSLCVTQMHLRTLNIAAGEIVRFIAVSDVRNYLELLDATGTSVAAAENFLQTTVPTAGRYTLIVRAYFSHQPINYTLSFYQLRNPCGASVLSCGQTNGSLDLPRCTREPSMYLRERGCA